MRAASRSVFLHLLRRGHAKQLQAVGNDAAHGIRQLQPGAEHRGGLSFDIAGIVEAVELPRQRNEIAVDMHGIIVPCGEPDGLRQLERVLMSARSSAVAKTAGSTSAASGTAAPSSSSRAIREQIRAWAYCT